MIISQALDFSVLLNEEVIALLIYPLLYLLYYFGSYFPLLRSFVCALMSQKTTLKNRYTSADR